ncbi:MAG: hypothetical protein GF398_11515 [Chitinivibrionales bacterium]|nr:hypothetical protein [Chitinivibrionales bacterium]
MSIDWDNDGIIDAAPVSVDINYNRAANSGQGSTTLNASWNDWDNLQYRGGGVIGAGSGLPKSNYDLRLHLETSIP